MAPEPWGVVHAAYDETLDRKVAIKLIRSERAESSVARERLLREAKAMARITHSNVVQVFEAGEHDGQLFIAMEFVQGETLDGWLENDRPWRAVLERFVAVGRGLAVAHEAGVIHRDFKPDNVLLDDSGVPKVADFGLAGVEAGDSDDDGVADDVHAEVVALTRTGAVLGTPLYMSPEQHSGSLADARSDQFSFCVALWTAVFGQRPFEGDKLGALRRNVLDGSLRPPPRDSPVPRRVRRALERGLHLDPPSRWASMAELVAELEHATTGGNRARFWVAGAALVVVGALVWPYVQRNRTGEACQSEAEQTIEAIWNGSRRSAVRDGLMATHVTYAEATVSNALPRLDEYAKAWTEARVESCLDARVRDAATDDTLDRSHWCLDRRLIGLEALVDALERADANVASEAVTAATGLARVRPCRDDELLARLPAPPSLDERPAVREVLAQLSRATLLETANRSDEGLPLARAAVSKSEELELPSLRAAAQTSLGALLESEGRYVDAEETLENAYFLAAEVGDLETALKASVRLIFVVGSRLARRDDGRRWGRVAELVLKQMRAAPDDFRRAQYLYNLGVVLSRTARDRDEAKILLERGLQIREDALGPDHPDVARSVGKLGYVAMLTFDYEQAKTLRLRESKILQTALGADHPAVARSLQGLAMVHERMGDHDEALVVVQRALSILETNLGPDHPELVDPLVTLANVHRNRSDLATAKGSYQRALQIAESNLGKEHLYVAQILLALGNVSVDEQDYPQAQLAYERALAIREKILGPEDSRTANCIGALANLHRLAGRNQTALQMCERALAVQRSALGPQHPRVADALRDCALVHGALGDDTKRTELLEQSLAMYRKFDDKTGTEAVLSDLGGL